MTRTFLSLVCLFLVALHGQCQTNIIYVPVQNLAQVVQVGVKVQVTLLQPWPQTANGIGYLPAYVPEFTDTNGVAWFTNLVWGNYGCQVFGRPGLNFGFSVQPGTTGTWNVFTLNGAGSYSNQLAIFFAATNVNNATGSNVVLQGLFNGVDPSQAVTNNQPAVAFGGIAPVAGTMNINAGAGTITSSFGNFGAVTGNGAGLTGLTPAQVRAVSAGQNISWTFQTNSQVYNVMDPPWNATCSGSNYNGVTILAGAKMLTVTNGQFTPGDVGKWAKITLAGGTNGAGGYADLVTLITNYIGANSVGISNASPNGITNSIIQLGWDDTAAAQALLTYIGTNSNPGGTFFIPRPMIIAGPLQDVSTAWTNHHNSQLIAPAMPLGGATAVDIVFAGPRMAAQNQQWATVTINNPQGAFSSVGGAIWSFLPFAPTINHASVIDFRNFSTPVYIEAPFGGYNLAMNNIKASAMNLTWSMCWDANLRLCNFEGADQVYIGNCFFTMGWANNQQFYLPVTMPNTVALTTSGYFNNNNSLVENCLVGAGFYNAIYAFDNASINNVTTIADLNGVVFPNGMAGTVNLQQDEFQESSNVIVAVLPIDPAYVYGHIMIVNNYLTNNAHDVVDTGGYTLQGHLEIQDFTYNHTSVYGGSATPSGLQTYYDFKQSHVHATSQAEFLFQDGLDIAQNLGMVVGADSGNVTLTPSTNKKWALGFTTYDPQNWAVPVMDLQASSGNNVMEIGGDTGYSYGWGGTNRAGITYLRFNLSSSVSAGNTTTHEIIDSSGNFYSGVGTETLGTAGSPWAAIYGAHFGNAAGLTNFTGLVVTNSPAAWLAANVFKAAPAMGFVTATVIITNQTTVWLTNATTHYAVGMGNITGTCTNYESAILPVNSGDNVSVTNLAGTGGYQLTGSYFQALH